MRSLMEKSLNLDYLCQIEHKVMKSCFYPMASATVYGWRPKLFKAEHPATAESEIDIYIIDVVENLR